MKSQWVWFCFIAFLAVFIVQWVFVGFYGNLDLVGSQAELLSLTDDSFGSKILVNYQLTSVLLNDLGSTRFPGDKLGWLTFFAMSLFSLILFDLARKLDLKQKSWSTLVDSCYFGPNQVVPYLLTVGLLLIQLLPAAVISSIGLSLSDSGFLPTPELQTLAINSCLAF